MRVLLIHIIVCGLSYTNSLAQGCSDAGFCTIGSIKPNTSDSNSLKQKELSIILTNGIGDEGVYVFTPALQYDHGLNNRWALQSKITANRASGSLGNSFGLGDLFLSALYQVQQSKKWKSMLTFGTKLPLNNGNIK